MDFGLKLLPLLSHSGRAEVVVSRFAQFEGLGPGLNSGCRRSPELTVPALGAFVLEPLSCGLNRNTSNTNGLSLTSRKVGMKLPNDLMQVKFDDLQ